MRVRAVRLRTVDLGGQREYLYSHSLFCTPHAVYVLCVPLDALSRKPPTDVVGELREYVSMVHMQAPDAPVELVFTKADELPDVTPDNTPTELVHWMTAVTHALHHEFPQVVASTVHDVSSWPASAATASAPAAPPPAPPAPPLVVSSKDGWESAQERVRRRWAQLAMTCQGAGDVLPQSYGAIRQALTAAGGAWKRNQHSRRSDRRGRTTRFTTTPPPRCHARNHDISGCGVHGDDENDDDDDDDDDHHHGDGGETKDAALQPCSPRACVFNPTGSLPGLAPLVMRWGTRVPVVSVSAVRDMAIKHCGFAPDADIRQPLLLLHCKGVVVFGGALHKSPVEGGDVSDVGRGAGFERGATSDAVGRLGLPDFVVLDPKWLANMLSRVVTQYARRRDNHGHACHGGRVPLHTIALAWQGYPDALRSSFLELLFCLEMAWPGMPLRVGAVADYVFVPALLLPQPHEEDGAGGDDLLLLRETAVKQVGCSAVRHARRRACTRTRARIIQCRCKDIHPHKSSTVAMDCQCTHSCPPPMCVPSLFIPVLCLPQPDSHSNQSHRHLALHSGVVLPAFAAAHHHCIHSTLPVAHESCL